MTPTRLLLFVYCGFALLVAAGLITREFVRRPSCIEHAAWVSEKNSAGTDCPGGHIDYLPNHSIVVCRCGVPK